MKQPHRQRQQRQQSQQRKSRMLGIPLSMVSKASKGMTVPHSRFTPLSRRPLLPADVSLSRSFHNLSGNTSMMMTPSLMSTISKVSSPRTFSAQRPRPVCTCLCSAEPRNFTVFHHARRCHQKLYPRRRQSIGSLDPMLRFANPLMSRQTGVFSMHV